MSKPKKPPREHATAFKCVACGLITTGRLPSTRWAKGDGSLYYPRRHRDSEDRLCSGVFDEAEWVRVPYGCNVFGGVATA